ncbi:MAG: glycoside hydrolase family 2 [Armatimonadetes bacterium]|nr:glycoside hydrolase family 2 [Armatimonadota bacterium]
MMVALAVPGLLMFAGDTFSSAGGAVAEDRRGLVLEYTFEDNVADSSGNGHDGAVKGNSAYVAGKVGKCLALDGEGDYLVADTNLAGLTGTFTIECWVKPDATQSAYVDLLGNHAGVPFSGFVLQQNGEQVNRYYFAYGTGKAWVYSKTVELTPDQWQHFAVVKTPDRLRLYLNGMLVDSMAAEEPMAESTTPFMVGNGIAGPPRCFKGMIDEVRVWNRRVTFESLLTPEQHKDLFERTGRLETKASGAGSIFRPGDKKEIELSIDPETVPASVGTLSVSFECTDANGKRTPALSPVTLRRSDGFKRRVPFSAEPGIYRVAYTLTVGVRAAAKGVAQGTFSFAVLRGFGSKDFHGTTRSGDLRPKARVASTSVVSLDGQWLLATDPKNVGREQKWFAGSIPQVTTAKVPWIIQDTFPAYHGVAWYWRDFATPGNQHAEGRYLLRFRAVDYLAEVWVNGVPVGRHEGGETPFVLDVTDAVAQASTLSRNRLAVRVLNPTHEPIDGLVLNQTPHRAKVIPYSAGASYNHGGIVDSVELIITPSVRIEDLYVWPDPKTGVVHIQATVHNALDKPVTGHLQFAVSPAVSGETLDAACLDRRLPPGDTLVEASLRINNPRLWQLNDPYLYRVTARAGRARSNSFDEYSVRCGFRDFRFENGYFRLNGRRLFIRSSHTVNAAPVGQQVPHDPDLFRRDLLYVKAMGFNAIRFIWGGATRQQLDLCDEIGLLVYEESYASQSMDDTPKLADRFDRSVAELIKRDRNHPSVVMWGLLNEASDNPSFRHAVGMLPLVRFFDDTRVVMLNSGRYDGKLEIGALSNPGASDWENVLTDVHVYPRVPHTAETIRGLRALDGGRNHAFLTEYGIGSAVDLWRVTRHFERLGRENAEDAVFYRDKLNRFLADWERWKLEECFGRPEDFFAASLRKMAGQRTLGLNAVRANPNLVGYSLTGTMDHVNCGEGLFTLFRELKPGTVDALFDGLAPLRLCLFAEPVNVYPGTTVHLEVVLANEDALLPGEYPLRLQVFGPDQRLVFERESNVTIPKPSEKVEPPFALPVFAEDMVVDGPSGKYRFVARFDRGAAATGGDTEFYLTDPADLPAVEAEVALWGEDPILARWLAQHGIRSHVFSATAPNAGEVILISDKPPAPAGASEWKELARSIARGATAVFLSPAVFARGDQPLGWLPMANKGAPTAIVGWLYLKDEWAKSHPIFEGLPAGGLMDYTFYRELIPDAVWSGQDPPAEAVAGAIKASQDYSSGLLVSVYNFGAGRFILNTLRIRENLGTHPAAERLLRNMLRYAARDAGKPLAEMPPDWEGQIKAIGYQ